MIPIRDTIQSKTYPIIRNTIIGINVIVFLWQLGQGPDLKSIFNLYGMVPIRYSDPGISGQFTFLQQLVPFFSYMFLHGGFLHLLGNMWFLYIFGDNVEDRLGASRFLAFYILSGMAAALIHLTTNWNSPLPTIGASGAIAGVMGAYFLLFPRSRVLTMVPIFIFPLLFELPAVFFLGYWVVIQFLYASLSHGQAGGVAWWAHIGGFIFGLATIKLFLTFPRSGISQRLTRSLQRRSTPRLQHIRPQVEKDLDTHGTIFVTPREALSGARKLVTIPYRRRTVVVTIPPEMSDGTRLRLRGMGRSSSHGERGDLYLTVKIARMGVS
ncbi:MAG: rhomboid family intramembrane serine protease [Syntrophobacterales bacterium]|nr:MAG: rhomboid family intramembrane serine protease [Syntrophobacterales bacterium]